MCSSCNLNGFENHLLSILSLYIVMLILGCRKKKRKKEEHCNLYWHTLLLYYARPACVYVICNSFITKIFKQTISRYILVAAFVERDYPREKRSNRHCIPSAINVRTTRRDGLKKRRGERRKRKTGKKCAEERERERERVHSQEWVGDRDI